MSELLARTWLRWRQLIRSLNRRRLQNRRRARQLSYPEWVQCHDSLTPAVRAALAQRLQALPAQPLISVLVLPPAVEPPTPSDALAQVTVLSVLRQLYPHWELCIASTTLPPDGAAQAAGQSRLRRIDCAPDAAPADVANALLHAAQGAWVVALPWGDTLSEHSLLLLAEAITQFAHAGLIYADEDQLNAQGQRQAPYFKPDWDADLALSQPLTSGLAAAPRHTLLALGGYRPALAPAHLHDLLLRCTEGLAAAQIVHIPHVLCHRAAPAAPHEATLAAQDSALQQAVRDHLQRLGRRAHISAAPCPAAPSTPVPGCVRVHYPLPEPAPLVSIIIPTRNQVHLLRKCIDTLTQRTDYPHCEVIVVDNGSDEPDAMRYIESLTTHPPGGPGMRLHVMPLPLRPFNYATLNNRAAEQARGELLVLMNNDIEVVEPGWLREMVSHALRPGVGAVGARLLYPDGSVQHAGVILGLSKGGAGIASPAHKGLPGNAAGHGQRAWLVQSYAAVTAACLVVRKALFDQVGGLDETHLAVAYNDVDLCLKLGELGLRNVWTPYATLIHHESISRGRDVAKASQERFQKEAAWMRERWGPTLDRDPAYNPNLNANTADFALADPPRVSLTEAWFKAAHLPESR